MAVKLLSEMSHWEAGQIYGFRTPCRAGEDGDCFWNDCPQLRDGEPHKTGRHCPLDKRNDDDH